MEAYAGEAGSCESEVYAVVGFDRDGRDGDCRSSGLAKVFQDAAKASRLLLSELSQLVGSWNGTSRTGAICDEQ